MFCIGVRRAGVVMTRGASMFAVNAVALATRTPTTAIAVLCWEKASACMSGSVVLKFRSIDVIV